MKEKANIYLVGFMGCGKSTIGWSLAQELGYNFIDSDNEIEKEEGISISEIFATKGEEYFREKELEFIRGGHPSEGQVISCGGGLVTREGRLEIMEEAGFVVCLYASFEEVWRRIKDSTNRPLLQKENPQEELQKLFHERLPFYQKVSTIIMTENRPTRDIVSHVKREYLSRIHS